MAYTKSDDDLGALWIKTSPKGDYMTGQIEVSGLKIGVVCFRNKDNPPNSNRPDWKILRGKPRADAGAAPQAHTAQRTAYRGEAPYQAHADAVRQRPLPPANAMPDDIPF